MTTNPNPTSTKSSRRKPATGLSAPATPASEPHTEPSADDAEESPVAAEARDAMRNALQELQSSLASSEPSAHDKAQLAATNRIADALEHLCLIGEDLAISMGKKNGHDAFNVVHHEFDGRDAFRNPKRKK